MSIIIDENTKVLVIGITVRHGSFQTQKMLEYGTKIVGGVVPGIKVYNTVKEALEEVEDMNFVEVLEMFEKDDETEKVVLSGNR